MTLYIGIYSNELYWYLWLQVSIVTILFDTKFQWFPGENGLDNKHL